MKFNIKSLFKKDLIPLYLILAIGVYLRIQTLLTNSFAFTYDVGRDLIAISQIASLEKVSLIGPTTGLPGVFYGPWWYLMLTPAFILAQGNPAGIEFVMFLAGVATIVLSYVAGRKISGNYTGLCFAAIVAFSPFLIFTSSQIWSPNLAPLSTILAALCLIDIFFKKKRSLVAFLLLGLALGLTQDLGVVYGTLLIVGVLISLVVQRRLKFRLKEILTLIAGIFIIFSPRILFEFKHNFLMTKSLIAFLTNSDERMEFGNLFMSRVSFMVDEFSQALAGNIQIFGILIAFITIFTLIFLRKYIKTEEKTFLVTTIVIITTFFIGALLFNHNLYPHYFAGLAIFFILPVVISLRLIAKRFNIYFSALLLLIIVIVNFNPISFFQNFDKPLFVGNAAVYRNQLAVVDYVYKEANGKDFKYVVYTPPVFDYSYRYLFDWYGVKKYGYGQRQQPDLAFFILEPDYESPQRLKDWLNIRRMDGKIVKSERLPSGIIVQTRINEKEEKQ